MASLVSKKYSKALYLVGEERNILNELLNDVKEVNEVLKKEKNILMSLNHPKLPLVAKQEILKELFEGKVRKEIIGLFNIILRKSRQEFIIEIFDDFIESCMKKDNVSYATISFADEVDDSVVRNIKEKIEKSINKKLEVETKVDKALIAGYKVKVGDLLFDGTVDGRIKNLKKAIS